MTTQTLALTGSTGHLGGMIARGLSTRGVAMRLLARTPDRAPSLPGATVVASTYVNSDDVRAGLDGVDVLFMVSGAESADRLDQHRAFIDAAAAAGVSHIVYTSFNGASPDATFTLARDHWGTEQHIIARGLPYTFLRNSFYADILPELADEDGVIRGPAGDGRLAPVTRADVARVAAKVLTDPAAHRNATYTLTGPQAITLTEAADIISETTGRAVTYLDETIEEEYESRRRWDAPQWQYDAWVSTYTAIAAGEFAHVTDDVATVTGRDAQSLREHFRNR